MLTQTAKQVQYCSAVRVSIPEILATQTVMLWGETPSQPDFIH